MYFAERKMKVHYLDYLNTSQVVHRENDLFEFNEILMNQLETIGDIAGADETPVDLFAEMDCDREWRSLQEMADAGCDLQIADNSVEILSPCPPPCSSLQPPVTADLAPPQIWGKNTFSICIKLNGRTQENRTKCNQKRRPKTILNVAARSRMPKRSIRTKPNRSLHIDDVVKQMNSRIEPKNSTYANGCVHVLAARPYRVVEHEDEPFKLTFVRINA